jgi:hypothetical protein
VIKALFDLPSQVKRVINHRFISLRPHLVRNPVENFCGSRSREQKIASELFGKSPKNPEKTKDAQDEEKAPNFFYQ